MLRYKAKIEDLEATLAQKGQVGIWFAGHSIWPSSRSPLCMGHTQDTAWLSTVTFLKCHPVWMSPSVRMSSAVFLSLVFFWPEREPSHNSECGWARGRMPEEEKPCTNSLGWSYTAKTMTHPCSCIRCLSATFMVLHFNVFHPYVSSLCAFWPLSLFASVVTSESPKGWSWIIQTEKGRGSEWPWKGGSIFLATLAPVFFE